MPDPMDVPPADHGSDRYDHIEIAAPDGMTPPAELLASSLEACGDCRANVFIEWRDDRWHRTIAHDDGCPTFATIEAEGS